MKRHELRHSYPGLAPSGLLGGAEYSDARMDDARLCIEVLRSASRHGAVVNNYVEAIAFERTGGVIRGGARTRSAERPGVHHPCPAGPQCNRPLGGQRLPAGRRRRRSRTSPPRRASTSWHLTPDCHRRSSCCIPRDGRVLFVIPWLTRTDPIDPSRTISPVILIGTTDTNFAGVPEELAATPDDEAYLLDAYNHFFSPPLTSEDVVGSFAGLRPLIRARTDEPSARSREFRIFGAPSGLLTVAGGKFTTYRHMAEVIVDLVAERLGQRRRCRTKEFRLDGAPQVPWREFAGEAVKTLRHRHRLDFAAAWHLVDRYGRRAADVARYLDARPDLAEPVVEGFPDLRVEFLYQRDEEMALRPEDFLLRRTRLGLVHPELLASVCSAHEHPIPVEG